MLDEFRLVLSHGDVNLVASDVLGKLSETYWSKHRPIVAVALLKHHILEVARQMAKIISCV